MKRLALALGMAAVLIGLTQPAIGADHMQSRDSLAVGAGTRPEAYVLIEHEELWDRDTGTTSQNGEVSIDLPGLCEAFGIVDYDIKGSSHYKRGTVTVNPAGCGQVTIKWKPTEKPEVYRQNYMDGNCSSSDPGVTVKLREMAMEGRLEMTVDVKGTRRTLDGGWTLESRWIMWC